MITLAIHQPNYLPWLGYFHKICHCDCFVLLDDVPFQQGNARSLTSRARIAGANGPFWITVPVKHGGTQLPVCDTMIVDDNRWKKKHLRALEHSYAKTPYFNEIYALLQPVLEKEEHALSVLNTALIRLICEWLEIPASFILSSSLGLEGYHRNDKIIAICRKLGAGSYLSGAGARKYQDESLFEEAGIALRYMDFNHPPYRRGGQEFYPGLSIADALFHCGKEVKTLISCRQ